MNFMRRVPWIAVVWLGFTAGGAEAGGPSVINTTAPALIQLVGATGGVPDVATGRFTVVARDVAANPIRGAYVIIDFTDCADVTICADQMDPEALTDCAYKNVRKFTNGLGEVTFTILGGSIGAGQASLLSLWGRAKIFVNGALMATPSVATYDLDGSGGVGAGDLSAWLTDFGSGESRARSDFDGSGSIGAEDLSAWLSVFGAGTSTESCPASCP